MTFQRHVDWWNSIVSCFLLRKKNHMCHMSLWFLILTPMREPWCWNIYLQNWVTKRYSKCWRLYISTMGCIGDQVIFSFNGKSLSFSLRKVMELRSQETSEKLEQHAQQLKEGSRKDGKLQETAIGELWKNTVRGYPLLSHVQPEFCCVDWWPIISGLHHVQLTVFAG